MRNQPDLDPKHWLQETSYLDLCMSQESPLTRLQCFKRFRDLNISLEGILSLDFYVQVNIIVDPKRFTSDPDLEGENCRIRRDSEPEHCFLNIFFHSEPE
jgi:hypothetical protein